MERFKNIDTWLTALKVLVFSISALILYYKLFANNTLEQLWHDVQQISAASDKALLALVILLMGVNWALEAAKWRLLVCRFEPVTFKTAVKAVFSGVFISLFINILMPNRMGEFAGRIIYVKMNKVKATLVTFIGSMGQLTATVIAGSVASGVFWWRFFGTEAYAGYAVVLAAAFVITMMLLLYYNIGVFSFLLNRFKMLKKFRSITSVFYFYEKPRLLEVLALSILRYSVFCFQFILLLRICDVHISYAEGFIAVPVIFLVQTVVPSTALTDLFSRGAASLNFLNYFSANDAGILTATYLLWVINIFIPGLIGAGFVALYKYRNGS